LGEDITKTLEVIPRQWKVSTSSIGSTLTWSLISSGACIRASLKILRLPLFSPQVSPAAPTP
jgi:hypothetical protein